MKVIYFLGLMGVLTGCTTARVATDVTWSGNEKVYISYWQGDCKPLLGCGRGTSHVRMCSVNGDNSLSCQDQKEIENLLNK